MTYRFLKRYRRKHTNKKADIPISQWENDLLQAFQRTIPSTIKENDYTPISPPPSQCEITTLVQRLKNGTAPGQYRISAELLKHAPPELYQLLTQILENIWIHNDVPGEWLSTTQVPLPKVPYPKEISDYRRIALSNTIYKVYAAFLLQQLQRYIPDLPFYQAGFFPNRSTDDHVFTLRRLSEERWRNGSLTYILALDLNKAFDKVNTHHLARVLQHYDVPAYLINRIIRAILQERTSVLWQGRRTNDHQRTQGVKQGCPISPCRLRIDMNLTNLQLPLILAYADDLTIVTDSLPVMDSVLREIETELNNIGLTINVKKSRIM